MKPYQVWGLHYEVHTGVVGGASAYLTSFDSYAEALQFVTRSALQCETARYEITAYDERHDTFIITDRLDREYVAAAAFLILADSA